MNARICDVCGAISESDAVEIGRASLNVLRQIPSADDILAARLTGQPSPEMCESFDICSACTAGLLLTIKSHQERTR